MMNRADFAEILMKGISLKSLQLDELGALHVLEDLKEKLEKEMDIFFWIKDDEYLYYEDTKFIEGDIYAHLTPEGFCFCKDTQEGFHDAQTAARFVVKCLSFIGKKLKDADKDLWL